MKIVLVALNARYTHSNPAVRYLRNEITAAGHDAFIREYSINQNYFDILDSITKESPDVIAFSVYIWNTDIVRALIPDIAKLLPGIRIILGGPEAGYNPACWTGIPGVTAVIKGPGEDAIRTLAANEFQTHGDTGIVIAEKKRHFSDIPFPYTDEDFEILSNRYIYYESSRGCPFACSYCLSSREDHATEFRSAEQTISELDRIIKADALVVKFVDRSFNADPARAREIWAHCIRNGGKSRFHFEIHPLLLSDDDFNLLADAPEGLFQFEIGVQSIHDKTLREIGRKSEWRHIRGKIERLVAMRNIHTHLDIIAGLPFETLEDIAESIDEVMSLGADHFQLGFLKVLPGTVMAERESDYGIVRTERAPYQILSNKWIDSGGITLLR
ncbi:MAG TPA: radical SAM protein, partial [Spirochaetota bacterium]|nr:radical SAM protein [Spirochaetota bacterium]